MDRHEPEMRERRLQHRLVGGVGVEPLQEPPHLFFEPLGCRRFEVHAFASHGAGHHPHRRRAVVTPRSDADWMHAASPRREQRRVPAEQPFRPQGLVVALRRVEHHLHDTFDVAIRRLQPGDVHSEPARD